MTFILRQLAVLALVLAGAGAAGVGTVQASACENGDPAYVGTYTLRGVMGVGSRLVLRRDGSFDYRLSYGAVNQRGRGCWSQQKDRLVLLPPGVAEVKEVSVLDSTEFSGLSLGMKDDQLVWTIGDSGRTGRYER